jgi:hypothetical protein
VALHEFVTLADELSLGVIGSSVLGRIFGSQRKEITGAGNSSATRGLYESQFRQNIVIATKSVLTRLEVRKVHGLVICTKLWSCVLKGRTFRQI